MRVSRRSLALTVAFLLFCGSLVAQQVALKTNLLYWATTTPNLGLEVALGKRLTLDVQAGYNPWQLNEQRNTKFKHFLIQPELRWWCCEKFNRGFWGIHALYGQFNVGGMNLPLGVFPELKDQRHQGWIAGAGISYGYQWYLGPHWNLEATIGAGYAYLRYDAYESGVCGPFIKRKEKHYFGPTRIGLSFVYLIKSKK